MRILFPVFKFDYGLQSRGASLEKTFFYPALCEIADVIPFWLEENGYPADIENLQKKIIDKAELTNPDLIFFILLKHELYNETIANLSNRWITINWFADDQWRFDSFTKKIAPLFHFSITVDKYSLPKYAAIGYKNVILSQWATPKQLPIAIEGDSYKYDVSFVGSKNLVREWYVHELKKRGIFVDCFGSGWENGRIEFSDIERIMRESRISLNISNSIPVEMNYLFFALRKTFKVILGLAPQKEGYLASLVSQAAAIRDLFFGKKRQNQIKARNFEIPSWGGFQVSHFCLGIEDFFMPGKEIVLYSSASEMAQIIKYYLEHGKEREAIRLAGQRASLPYTYVERMKYILACVQKKINES